MFKDLIAKLKTALATLTLTAEQRKPIEDQITALEAEANKEPEKKPDGTTTTPTNVQLPKEVLEALVEVKSLKELIATEATARKTAEDAMKAKLAGEQKGKIDEVIKKALEKKQLTPANEKKYRALLEKDFDPWKEQIEALPVDPAAKKGSKADDKKPDGDDATPKMDGSDYQKNRGTYLEEARAAFSKN